MGSMHQQAQAESVESSDDDLVARVLGGDVSAFAVLMRRYNGRLFRVVRSVVRDDADAEDVCQEAWIRGYRYLEDLQDGASFSTWLARTAWRYALARAEQHVVLVELDEHELVMPDAIEADSEDELDFDRERCAGLVRSVIAEIFAAQAAAGLAAASRDVPCDAGSTEAFARRFHADARWHTRCSTSAR